MTGSSGDTLTTPISGHVTCSFTVDVMEIGTTSPRRPSVKHNAARLVSPTLLVKDLNKPPPTLPPSPLLIKDLKVNHRQIIPDSDVHF